MSIVDRLRDKLARRMTVRVLGDWEMRLMTDEEFNDPCFRRKYRLRLSVYPGTANGRNRTYGVDEWIMASHFFSTKWFKDFLTDRAGYSRRLRRNNLLLTRSNLWQWLK